MAEYIDVIPDYESVEWHNYLPPSIDQDNLNHLEKNVLLNRNTINEIIRKMGIKPEGTSSEDTAIYVNPIYETLIAHKDELKRLENAKLDKSLYLSQLGDFNSLITSSPKTIVNAINNRLRKDTNDSSAYSYTFKSLTLNGGTVNDLNVVGQTVLGGKLTVNNEIKSGAIWATDRSSFEHLTVRETALVSKRLEVGQGIGVTGDSFVSGTLTVTNLNVTGNITCDGNITGQNVTANADLWAKGNCKTNGAFYSIAEYICFHWGQNPEHRLYCHGGGQALGGGDAFIQTVT